MLYGEMLGEGFCLVTANSLIETYTQKAPPIVPQYTVYTSCLVYLGLLMFMRHDQTSVEGLHQHGCTAQDGGHAPQAEAPAWMAEAEAAAVAPADSGYTPPSVPAAPPAAPQPDWASDPAVVSAITVKEPERIQAMEIDDSEWGNNDSRPASQAQGAVHSDSNAPSWMGAAKASVQEAMGGLTGSDPNAAQGGGEGGAANGRKLSCACSCRNMRPNKGSMVLLYSIGTLATFVLLVYSLLPGQNAPSCSGDACANCNYGSCQCGTALDYITGLFTCG